MGLINEWMQPSTDNGVKVISQGKRCIDKTNPFTSLPLFLPRITSKPLSALRISLSISPNRDGPIAKLLFPTAAPQTRLGRLRLHENTKAAKVLPHRLYDVLGYHAIWVHEPCAARLDVRYGLTTLSRETLRLD